MTTTQIVLARMIRRMAVRMINRTFIRFMIGLNKKAADWIITGLSQL